MVVEFAPAGSGATQTFLLENSSNERVAIQLEVKTRETSPDGKENRKDTKDFLIFPEQLSLDAGERRNVRVTYIGEQNLKGEKPFRFIASQLPVDFKKKIKSDGVNLNFLLQYVASVYVSSSSASSNVQVESVQSKNEKIELVLKNSGNKHQLLNTMTLSFSAKDANGKTQKWKLNNEELKNYLSDNLLPNSKRKYVIAAPKDFPLNDLKVDFKL